MNGKKNFRLLRKYHLTCVNHTDVLDNVLHLCATCHEEFDDKFHPNLVILLKHLNFFFDWEERWQSEFDPLDPRNRTAPTAETYQRHCESLIRGEGILEDKGGFYVAYMDLDFLPPLPPGYPPLPNYGEYQWHGDPGAMVFHAIQAAVRMAGLDLLPEVVKDDCCNCILSTRGESNR